MQSDLTAEVRSVTRTVNMWTRTEVVRNGWMFELSIFTVGPDRQPVTFSGSYTDIRALFGDALCALEAEGRALDAIGLRRE